MSEGLLKKRILALEDDEDEVYNAKTDDWSMQKIGGINLHQVIEILDEAKQDFWNIFKEIEFNSEPEEHIDGLYAKMVLKRLGDFGKKWFGEGSA